MYVEPQPSHESGVFLSIMKATGWVKIVLNDMVAVIPFMKSIKICYQIPSKV